jgi:hypothetical protein
MGHDTQYNDTDCDYADCRILVIFKLNVIILSVITVNAVMLIVIMLSA